MRRRPGGGYRALRLGELAGGLLCFGQKGEHPRGTGLVPSFGGARETVQHLEERTGITGNDAANAEPKGEVLRLAERDQAGRRRDGRKPATTFPAKLRAGLGWGVMSQDGQRIAVTGIGTNDFLAKSEAS